MRNGSEQESTPSFSSLVACAAASAMESNGERNTQSSESDAADGTGQYIAGGWWSAGDGGECGDIGGANSLPSSSLPPSFFDVTFSPRDWAHMGAASQSSGWVYQQHQLAQQRAIREHSQLLVNSSSEGQSSPPQAHLQTPEETASGCTASNAAAYPRIPSLNWSASSFDSAYGFIWPGLSPGGTPRSLDNSGRDHHFSGPPFGPHCEGYDAGSEFNPFRRNPSLPSLDFSSLSSEHLGSMSYQVNGLELLETFSSTAKDAEVNTVVLHRYHSFGFPAFSTQPHQKVC